MIGLFYGSLVAVGLIFLALKIWEKGKRDFDRIMFRIRLEKEGWEKEQ